MVMRAEASRLRALAAVLGPQAIPPTMTICCSPAMAYLPTGFGNQSADHYALHAVPLHK
jgi:hypothetical protein